MICYLIKNSTRLKKITKRKLIESKRNQFQAKGNELKSEDIKGQQKLLNNESKTLYGKKA